MPVVLPDLALLDAFRAADRCLARQGRLATRVVLVTTPPRPSAPTAAGECIGAMVKLHGAMARAALRAIEATGIPSAADQVNIRTMTVSHHRNRSPGGLHRGWSTTAPPPVTHGTAADVRSSMQVLPQRASLRRKRDAAVVQPSQENARNGQTSNKSAPAQFAATPIILATTPTHPPPPRGSVRTVLPTEPEAQRRCSRTTRPHELRKATTIPRTACIPRFAAMDQVGNNVTAVASPATAATPTTMSTFSVPVTEFAINYLMTITGHGTSPSMHRHTHLGLQQAIRISIISPVIGGAASMVSHTEVATCRNSPAKQQEPAQTVLAQEHQVEKANSTEGQGAAIDTVDEFRAGAAIPANVRGQERRAGLTF